MFVRNALACQRISESKKSARGGFTEPNFFPIPLPEHKGELFNGGAISDSTH
jgi:hypothetical protein